MGTKAIIVEDEQNNVDILSHFVTSYCKQIKLVGSASTVQQANELITDTNPDLIFLDIMLEEGTGFDLLELIKDKEIQIIFITAYNDFALKAFKYSAVDYLLKPLQIDELVEAVEKAEKRLQNNTIKSQIEILMEQLSPTTKKNNDDFLAIPMVDKIEFIKIEEIFYIMADGKYSTFLLANGKSVISSRNIGEYEKLLSGNNLFFRVHNTYLVNLNFVDSIGKIDGLYCIMNNNKQIPISRRKKDDLFVRLKIK